MLRWTIFDLSIFGADDDAANVTTSYFVEPSAPSTLSFRGHSEGTDQPALTELPATQSISLGNGDHIFQGSTGWAAAQSSDRAYAGHDLTFSGRYRSFGAEGIASDAHSTSITIRGRHERQPGGVWQHETASTVMIAGFYQPELAIGYGTPETESEYHPRLQQQIGFTGAHTLISQGTQHQSQAGAEMSMQGFYKQEPGANVTHRTTSEISITGAHLHTADGLAKDPSSHCEIGLTGWSQEGLGQGQAFTDCASSVGFGGMYAPAGDYWGDEKGELVTDQVGDPIPI